MATVNIPFGIFRGVKNPDAKGLAHCCGTGLLWMQHCGASLGRSLMFEIKFRPGETHDVRVPGSGLLPAGMQILWVL